MARDPRPPPDVIRQARAARLAIDLIIDCERAASRRNPRDCDPLRWSKTAWRRYLHAAARSRSLAEIDRSPHPRDKSSSPGRDAPAR